MWLRDYGLELRIVQFQLPGIGYNQGSREMVVTAMDPIALVKAVAPPEQWNPVGEQPHGNRPVDKPHRKRIANYLADEENFVLNAVVLYAKPQEARFKPDAGSEESSVRPGTLFLNYGAQFDVGDGQHRIAAYSDVMQTHQDEEDPVRVRMRASGQPTVVVIDGNPLHRAQDFTDLQRNTKAQTTSLAMSMDRRQPINRLLIGLVQDPELPVFGEGASRVEFFNESPGKFSSKLFSSWAEPLGLKPSVDRLGNLPWIADVIKGDKTTAELRSHTYLGSAGVQYAIAYALHRAHEDHSISISTALERLSHVDFARPATVDGRPLSVPVKKEDTVFAGTLVDPDTGKVGSGPPAWEAAGDDLLEIILKR